MFLYFVVFALDVQHLHNDSSYVPTYIENSTPKLTYYPYLSLHIFSSSKLFLFSFKINFFHRFNDLYLLILLSHLVEALISALTLNKVVK